MKKTNPYRATNFKQDDEGNLICPNGKKFNFKFERHIKGNQYGCTEEIYECESCEGCPTKKNVVQNLKLIEQLD